MPPPRPFELRLLCEELERFFQPGVAQDAREQMDKWKKWNVRLRFYWETKDEDENPYALTDDIKEWLLENFNYDVDRIGERLSRGPSGTELYLTEKNCQGISMRIQGKSS